MVKYSMADLAQAVNKTGTHIRTNIFKKEPFKSLLKEHKIKEANTGKVFYDEVILQALKDYYSIEEPTQEPEKKETVADGVGVEKNITGDSENPEINPPPVGDDAKPQDDTRRLIDVLEQQLEAEKKRNADLEKQLHDKEAERVFILGEYMRVNKQLLLMAPAKKTLRERIKQLFAKDKGGTDNTGNGPIE